MPYIKQEDRPPMDEIVNLMVKNGVQADGDLNYVLFKFCKYHISPSYNKIKNFLAELEESNKEIRRRLLVSHEDKKIEENGDV